MTGAAVHPPHVPHAPPAGWFRNQLISGLQLLLSLGLDGTPASEVITLTTSGWIETLWRRPVAWDEERDAPRLQEAFLALARTVRRWPAPAQLLDCLPAAAAPRALPAPKPAFTVERRAQLAELRRAIAASALGARPCKALQDAPRDRGDGGSATVDPRGTLESAEATGGETGADRAVRERS